MKSIILSFFIAVGLFFAGCSEQSSINSPQQDSQLSLVKMSDGNSLHKTISVSKTINGNIGGSLDIVGSFDLGIIQVNGTLTVPPGAYQGNQTITAYMDGVYAVIDFGPSPFIFDIPLNFTMEITGVKLTGNVNAIKFVYIAPDGTMQPVELNGTTEADRKGNMLSVYDAQLPHFSRYGWAK